jgi:hypothetical protein
MFYVLYQFVTYLLTVPRTYLQRYLDQLFRVTLPLAEWGESGWKGFGSNCGLNESLYRLHNILACMVKVMIKKPAEVVVTSERLCKDSRC